MWEANLTLKTPINFYRATEINQDQVKTLDKETKIDALSENTSGRHLRMQNNQNKTCRNVS